MMKNSSAWMMLFAMVMLAGCYRFADPPDPDETVRLEIVGNESRLVRVQGYLADAVARELTQRLGWRISPQGTAVLQLSVEPDQIQAAAHDERDVSEAWQVRIRGTALLKTRQGSIVGSFTGVGHYTGLHHMQDESAALEAAARQAASNLASWLDVVAKNLVPQAAASAR